MASTSGNISIQFHGYRDSQADINSVELALPNLSGTTSPNMTIEFDWSITRGSETDGDVNIKISNVTMWRLYSSGSPDSKTGNYSASYYGYSGTLQLRFGDNSTWRTIMEKPQSPGTWSNDRTDWCTDLDFNISWAKSSNMPIYIRYHGGCYTYQDMECGDYDVRATTVKVPTYNPWSGPSTSGFYINRSPNRVKPDGTITAKTGGMSGGSGNGSTKAYQIYFTIYRGSNKIYTSSRFDGASKSFKPSDYYADTRPGDKVYVHGVGRSKNANGDWYNVIDKAADAVTVYKDGAIYYKNSSGSKVECTSGYYKDSSSTKRSARYVKIKDSGGSTRIIDVYTSAY